MGLNCLKVFMILMIMNNNDNLNNIFNIGLEYVKFDS